MALDRDDLAMMAESAERLVAAPGAAGWAEFAELGWLALPMAEANGGFGAGLADLAIILRVAGAARLPDPLISTLVLGAGLIAAAGSESQCRALLPAIAAGDLKLAFAHHERDGGQDRTWVRTSAMADGAGWRLDGGKYRVLDAPVADRLLVSAAAGDGTTGLFLVDPADAAVHSYTALDGRPMADLEFAACAAERLGDGDAAAAIDLALDRACVATAIDACGAMLAANRATLDYLKTRRQFGTAIGSFQALQHRMVDMSVASTQALATVHAAAAAIDRGDPEPRRRVSAAKIVVDRAATLIGEQAIQLHGGIGVTEEYSVGHLLKRLLLARWMYGDSDWHLQRLQDLDAQG